MSHLRIQCKYPDGRSVEITPSTIEPLGVQHLWKLKEDPASGIEFKIKGRDAISDGNPLCGEVSIRTTINFTHPPKPVALVPYGWLPMPFVVPQRFLVDRNVVSILRRIRERGMSPQDQAFSWWIEMFEGGSGIFNPLLYAYEGAFRRIPTYIEFVTSYEDGVDELKTAFPKANVIEFSEPLYRGAYAQLTALAERGERETAFIVEAIPLVLERVSRTRDEHLRDTLIRIAGARSINPGSLVVLAVLSVLYDDTQGKVPSIGRRLLKPKSDYSLHDAYNAISDLRHIELAALSHAVIDDGAFSLCTNDHALAEFWCSLSPYGFRTPDALLNIGYTIGIELMPRLSAVEIASIATLIRDF